LKYTYKWCNPLACFDSFHPHKLYISNPLSNVKTFTISISNCRANPGGGKEIIDEYLERTKDEVEKTEGFLRSVLGYLNLEVLPPSKNMQ
jgi:hypothetical protein